MDILLTARSLEPLPDLRLELKLKTYKRHDLIKTTEKGFEIQY